jgi:hypothetical protein
MSWWTDVRDTAEVVGTGGTALFVNKSARNKVEGGINAVLNRPSAADKRAQAGQVNAQIQAYKDQTALSQKAIDDARTEKDVVKRQVNEKQIRQLRNNYRPSGGFLGAQNHDTSTLGTSTGLPNKLGA